MNDYIYFPVITFFAVAVGLVSGIMGKIEGVHMQIGFLATFFTYAMFLNKRFIKTK